MSDVLHQARTNYSHDDRTDYLRIEDVSGTPHLVILDFGRQDQRAGIFMNKAQWQELAAVAAQIAANMDDKPKGSPTAEHLTNDGVLALQEKRRQESFERILQGVLNAWATFTWNDGWASERAVNGVTGDHFDTLVSRGLFIFRETRGLIEYKLTEKGRLLSMPITADDE